MKPFKYIAIDDEKSTHLILDHCLKGNENFEKVGDFYNPIEALQYLKDNPIDLIFLDIEMPELNGFELLENIQYKVSTIIITAYAQQYALNGYQFISKGVIDFLSKPFGKAELEASLTRFVDSKSQSNILEKASEIKSLQDEPQIQVQEKERIINLDISAIRYIFVSGNYVYFNTIDNKRYEKYSTLEEVIKHLPPTSFLQTHRKYVVMKKHILRYNGTSVYVGKDEMDKEIILPISSRRQGEIREQIMTTENRTDGKVEN